MAAKMSLAVAGQIESLYDVDFIVSSTQLDYERSLVLTDSQ